MLAFGLSHTKQQRALYQKTGQSLGLCCQRLALPKLAVAARTHQRRHSAGYGADCFCEKGEGDILQNVLQNCMQGCVEKPELF